MTRPVRCYWWAGLPNFGDLLGPELLRRFAGVEVEWAAAAEAEVAVIGSITEHLPSAFAGTLLGIGKANATTQPDFGAARVLALRGPRTLEGSGAGGDPVLGDPGLLAAEFMVGRPSVKYDIGVLPHYSDKSLASRYPGAHVINPLRPPLAVIGDIASCQRIVASSLHGLIVADSLGLPRRWERFERVQGNGFKFVDYAAALGEELVPDQWGTADPDAVRRICESLKAAFAAYGQEVRGE